MTSERPYHVPRTLPEALEEVRRSTGSQFAPEAVAGLERLLDAGLSRRRAGRPRGVAR